MVLDACVKIESEHRNENIHPLIVENHVPFLKSLNLPS